MALQDWNNVCLRSVVLSTCQWNTRKTRTFQWKMQTWKPIYVKFSSSRLQKTYLSQSVLLPLIYQHLWFHFSAKLFINSVDFMSIFPFKQSFYGWKLIHRAYNMAIWCYFEHQLLRFYSEVDRKMRNMYL